MTDPKPTPTDALPFGALAFLAGLVKVARAKGYALSVHGSLTRDFDFIAVPWVEEAVEPRELLEAIRAKCGGIITEPEGEAKPHGRHGWQIHLGAGPYIDLSIISPLRFYPDPIDDPLHGWKP